MFTCINGRSAGRHEAAGEIWGDGDGGERGRDGGERGRDSGDCGQGVGDCGWAVGDRGRAVGDRRERSGGVTGGPTSRVDKSYARSTAATVNTA